MGFSSKDSVGQPLSEINVTPLVDVMLVLLIIFMVTAPMIQQGIEVDLPQTSTEGSLSMGEKDVVVTVDQKKQIFINETPLQTDNLTEQFKAVFKNKSVKVAYLQSDKSVDYGFVVQVMNALKGAGVEHVGLVTQDDS